MKFLSHGRRATEEFARTYAKKLRGGSVFALVGQLGSGKTTFVQAFARALGVRRRLTSPTFVLMRVYKSKVESLKSKVFVHVDAYRVRSVQELIDIGLREYIGRKDTVVVIEWADQVKALIPKNATRIQFDYRESLSERTITIQQRGKSRRRT